MSTPLLRGRRDPRSRSRMDPEPKLKTLRPDIQGLRAIAVISVVLDHLLGWPLGGFIGVDIFFVISGFLITGHLLRKQEQTGRVSFTDFYRKRLKRIMPAAVLVLIVTVAAGYVFFNHVRADDTLVDGLWALLFGANWHQIVVGTDYFAAAGPVSPLQHYWSLAVEEQFYFVWPVLMAVTFWFASRRVAKRASATSPSTANRADPRPVALIVMGAVTLLSFGWAVWETATTPVVAYFSTLDRAWELGAGALLAIITPALLRIPHALRPVLAWAGLTGIVVAFATTAADAGFPAPAAALPVLATAAVIAAGTGAERHRGLAPITNPVARYLGDISYSIYLWHFPVIVFGLTFVDEPTVTSNLLTGAVILVLAVLAYHLVEDPIRQSPWLTGAPHWVRHYAFPDGYKYFAMAGLVALTVGLAVPLVLPHPPSAAEVAQAKAFDAQVAGDSAASPAPTPTTAVGPAISVLQKELSSAVAQTSWPALSPSLDDVLRHNTDPKGVNECGTQTRKGAACVWGNPRAAKTAVLVGDSIAISWMPALIELYGHGDWKLRMLAKYGCPFIDRTGDSAECVEHRAAVAAEVASAPPTLLIVANNYPDSGRNASPWGSRLASMLAKVPGAAATVVIAPPPHSADVKACYRPASTPLDCLSTADGWYHQIVNAEKQTVMAAGAAYAETEPLFCAAASGCPPFAGSTPTKLDAVHPTVAYATKIAPALAEAIAGGQAATQAAQAAAGSATASR